MPDNSSFSIGDLGTAFGSLIKDTGAVFRDQVLTAGQNKAVLYSQKIVDGLSKTQQATSRILGVAKPSEMNAPKPPDDAGTAQIASVKLFGYALTSGQMILVSIVGGAALVGLLSWMRTRS